MTASAGGTHLGIHGDIAEPLRGKGIGLDFDLTVPSMQELQTLLGIRLPSIQSLQLHGQLQERAGKYRVVDLAGKVGATSLTGGFEADLTQDRPILHGNIDIRTLDAGPFLSALREDGQGSSGDPEPANEPGAGSAQPIGSVTKEAIGNRQVDLDAPVLVLDLLSKLDARFNLSVHEVVNTRTSLRDANLEIWVENGALTAPLSVTFAEVPFKGGLQLVPKNGQPRIALRLGATQSDIGELARFLVGSEGIEGEFHLVELAFAARGESIRSLIESAQLNFDMTGAALSYGHDEVDGKVVGFTLEEAHMSFPVADESTISAEGSLLGEPFTLEANGGTFIENFIDLSWPLKLRASGGGAQVDIDGIVRRVDLGRGSEIGFAVNGESIGDLAPWIGVSPKASQSYELNGKVTRNEQGLRIGINTARIGVSAFTV